MTTGSAAASIWWTFWGDYISATFQPWWKSAKVPTSKDQAGLALSSWPTSLTEDLDAWTTGTGSPPSVSAFTLPSGGQSPDVASDAAGVRHRRGPSGVEAGRIAVDRAWSKLHTREFPSLTGRRGWGTGRAPPAATPGRWTLPRAASI